MPPRVSGEVLENARFPIFKKRLLQAQAYNIKIKVNPNTTFYSYYFFPRAPRSDFEVLFLSFFEGVAVGRVGHVRRVGPVRLKVSECGERGG